MRTQLKQRIVILGTSKALRVFFTCFCIFEEMHANEEEGSGGGEGRGVGVIVQLTVVNYFYEEAPSYITDRILNMRLEQY